MAKIYRLTTLLISTMLLSGLAGCQSPGNIQLNADDLSEQFILRNESDRQRDAGRKPAEVLSFLGIAEGMTVLDILAASGWYTEVLSHAVGPSGKVYAHNTPGILKMRNGTNDKAMAQRLINNRLPNVERLDREFGNLGLAPDSIDLAITALNFHDVYNGGGEQAAVSVLRTLYTVMKPGGIVGIIDHQGAPGNDNNALHRIQKSKALAVIEQTSFKLESDSTLLENPNDDMTTGVFNPAVRGQTHRFVLKLKKQP